MKLVKENKYKEMKYELYDFSGKEYEIKAYDPHDINLVATRSLINKKLNDLDSELEKHYKTYERRKQGIYEKQ